ncbi:MAG: spore coat U domain-containing protein [Pseudohongiella sp.]|nr:spore coat U domain-containing protein [Pseudohongiella sp.]
MKSKIAFLIMALTFSGSVAAKTCTLTGASIAFGAYDSTVNSNVDAIGMVSLTCDGRFRAVLSMDVGNGPGAAYSSGRVMTGSSGGVMKYNLYANASRTQVLGDGTGGSFTLGIDSVNSYTQPIWGRIQAGQYAVYAGVYSDLLVVTVTY